MFVRETSLPRYCFGDPAYEPDLLQISSILDQDEDSHYSNCNPRLHYADQSTSLAKQHGL